MHKAFLCAALLLAIAGCSDPPRPTGSVIVGVTSDLRPGVDITKLHAAMRVNGTALRDSTLNGATLAFPTELRFDNLDDGDGIEAELSAFGQAGDPLLTRVAKSRILAGKALILPVRLDAECAGLTAPQCPAPLTCISGSCNPSFVDPHALRDYTPGWAGGKGDVCKPAGAGAPVVTVGEGQADYLPMDDLDVAQVEAGPQGGFHIWVAVRMKNLRQSGSITTVTGYVPDLNFDISPFSVIFTFDQDEGGYCKLYGLRFQLDTDIDIQQLLGKTLRVTVKIKDSEGALGTGERLVTLSDTIL